VQCSAVSPSPHTPSPHTPSLHILSEMNFNIIGKKVELLERAKNAHACIDKMGPGHYKLLREMATGMVVDISRRQEMSQSLTFRWGLRRRFGVPVEMPMLDSMEM
jgi:hypothetical protein